MCLLTFRIRIKIEQSSRDVHEESKKRKKGRSSGWKEKKVERVEYSIDPFTATPELLSHDTQEVVAAFRGVVPFSKYVSDTLLSRRLRILNTKEVGLYLITSACSPTDRTPLDLGKDALDDLVRCGLLLFFQVFLAFFVILFQKNWLTISFFQMLPLQLQLGTAIVSLSKEKASTTAQLKKVQQLEHELMQDERRLAMERVTRDELEIEAAQKENNCRRLKCKWHTWPPKSRVSASSWCC